jgi:DNA-binding MarR family transcriptional regulator
MNQIPPADQVAPPARLWRLPSWLLTHVASRSYRVVIQHVGSADDRADYAILAGLDEFGPVSQAALGRRLGLDRSDVVALLNRLEAASLVARRPDQRDPRRNAVRVTPAGSRRLRQLDDRVDAAQDTLLEPLSPAERQQFVRLLHRLMEHHTAFRSPADPGH